MAETRKKISISSTAPLITYGGIMGPIRRPFYETISNISILISCGAEVYEHIGDKKIKLNMLNFDTDNSGGVLAEQTPVKAIPTTEKSKDDSIIRIAVDTNKNQNFKNKDKYNKDKARHSEPVVDAVVADDVVTE